MGTMVTVPWGKTASVDIAVSTAAAAGLTCPSGSVGVMVGNGSGLAGALLIRALDMAIMVFMDEIAKQAPIVTSAKVAITPGLGRASAAVTTGSAILVSETVVAAVSNVGALGTEEGATALVWNSLNSCRDWLREQINLGLVTGAPA